jgi:hypothetical protein
MVNRCKIPTLHREDPLRVRLKAHLKVLLLKA